jgi:hypothetical protein
MCPSSQAASATGGRLNRTAIRISGLSARLPSLRRSTAAEPVSSTIGRSISPESPVVTAHGGVIADGGRERLALTGHEIVTSVME